MSTIQYTIRNIPLAVDRVIRKRAAREGKSFNQTVIELLTLQTFGTTKPKQDTNFDWLYGAGTASLDKEFDQAIAAQSEIDPRLWR